MDAPARLWPARYRSMDALRATAAMLVVLHHLHLGDSINIGQIAVMVFFVISGYCIAATAESSLRQGSGFGVYMKRRLRRIYPPYLFAVCFFIITRLAKAHFRSVSELAAHSWTQWLQTFTLTQWLSLVFHPTSYASENHSLVVAAFWSLNYEEQFYLVVGGLMLLAIRFRQPLLTGVLAIMVPAVAWNIAFPSTSYGFFLEYWVHFSLGVIVYFRLCRQQSRFVTRAIDGGLAAFCITSLLIGILWHGADFVNRRSVYLEWAITAGFALFLILGRAADDWFAQRQFGRALIRFGALTYSLYLVHQFNLHIAYSAAALFARVGMPHLFMVPIEILTMIAIAAVFWYFCERPFLNKPVRQVERIPDAVLPAPQLSSAAGM